MTVIGDSVTAGLGTDETAERWTEILERNRNIQVQDLSHVGETAASALKRASNETITHPLVVVEIGGNDILGVAPSSTKFANDLECTTEPCHESRSSGRDVRTAVTSLSSRVQPNPNATSPLATESN